MGQVQLRGGHRTEDPRLDRLPPTDWEHVEKYPLTAATAPMKPQPVVFGINWYANFDKPQRDGNVYWIGRGDLGQLRGGHAIAGRPRASRDGVGWWAYYDQGVEGRCVEFAIHRMLSHLNRKRYDIQTRWLYHEAQKTDEWEGGSYPGASPNYEGTSVRAGLEVVRQYGAKRSQHTAPDVAEGIAAYRWITESTGGWQAVRDTLGVPSSIQGVPLLNSWGRGGYPHTVYITDEAGERVLREDGEVATVTDR